MASGIGLVDELRVYRRLVGARLRGQMQYRASFVTQVLANLGLHALELLAVVLLFRRFEDLGGWSVGEFAVLHGLSALSFGIAHTLGAGFHSFAQQVGRGDFDRVLTRPVAPFLQVLAADLQLRRLGGVLQGLAALVVAFQLVEIPWDAGRVLYLPVVVVSATVLFLALFTLEATCCFWTTEATEVVNAFTYGGTNLAQYPLHVFDAWLRRLFLFAVPLGLVIYAPALYLLGKPDPLGLPGWSRFLAPLAALAFALLAGLAWGAGVRHYRSTGT